MTNKANDCELFNPANTEKARDRLKNKIKKSFEPAVQTIMEQAKKAVLHPESMDDQEVILLETVRHYSPERDSPDVCRIKSFDEWRKGEGNG